VSTAPASAGVLLLDFDGTVSVGDEPVLLYARLVAEAAGEPAILARVEDFLGGGDRLAALGASDGYQLVARLATATDVPAEILKAAYDESRGRVDSGEVPIAPPEGLAELLGELPDGIHVALVTNAPADSLGPVLEGFGLSALIDETVGSAAKPERMPEHVERLLSEHGLTDTPTSLLSIGDIWGNDLAAAHERGCRTGLIDRFGFSDGDPDVSAPDFPGLYAYVRRWSKSLS
jgi:phosphoglycolate phosphatase-like HAD superfamily hydrolase